MREVVPKESTERLVGLAKSVGLVDAVKNSRSTKWSSLLGLTLEYLGYAVIQDRFPAPQHLVSTPIQTGTRLSRIISDQERRLWQPAHPDGLVCERTDDKGSLKLVALAEYKTVNALHLDKLQIQYDSFVNLLEFLSHNNAIRGRSILRKLFRRDIPRFEVDKEANIIYVVPNGLIAEDIPTSLAGKDRFIEIVLPLKSRDTYNLARGIRNLQS